MVGALWDTRKLHKKYDTKKSYVRVEKKRPMVGDAWKPRSI